MTNEQAIFKLKSVCNKCEEFPKCVNTDSECFKAIEMAIMALETSCDNCPLSADGDCISRKSVIQLTREMISAEEYGLMDLLDEVKKLPTIPPLAKGGSVENGKLYIEGEHETELLPTIPQTDSVLEDIKADIDNESIGYPPSADYYKAIKKAVRIIEKHISGKENE